MNQEGGGGHTRERWVVRCLCLKGLERKREGESGRERERMLQKRQAGEERQVESGGERKKT